MLKQDFLVRKGVIALRIRLAEEGEDLQWFRYRIGNKVRTIPGKTVGTVIGGDAYPSMGMQHVYYRIRLFKNDVEVWIVREGDIELVP